MIHSFTVVFNIILAVNLSTQLKISCNNLKTTEKIMTTTDLHVKNIVVVGDGAVGKTCLLHRFHGEDITEEYFATVYDKSEFDIVVDGETHTIKLHDTAGQEEYDRLRRIIYRFADVFLLCYSVDNRASYLNLSKWANEVRKECANIPIMLCATKIDLRSSVLNCVTKMEGEEAKNELKALSFVECSAKRDIGVKEVIQEAVRVLNYESSEEQECDIVKNFCCWIDYLKQLDFGCFNK